MKRLFDILFSFMGMMLLTPLGIILALLIKLDTKGPVFFSQTRVGRGQSLFQLYKFRTMHIGAEESGQLTVGSRDRRITRVGYWLRRFKLDELPQLWNVFVGDMSLVGPRPEVKKYVDKYTERQKRVFVIRPGITDWASVRFRNENELIAANDDPEYFYLHKIMPIKLEMNLKYIDERSMLTDIKIILLTLFPFLNSRTMRKLKGQIDINTFTEFTRYND